MIEPDATMTRIGQGMELSQRGDRDAARHLFEEVWNDIGGESGDPCAAVRSPMPWPTCRMTRARNCSPAPDH